MKLAAGVALLAILAACGNDKSGPNPMVSAIGAMAKDSVAKVKARKSGGKSGGKTVWVDLFNPTNEEISKACGVYGVDIPPREQLDEIEFSSRLQYEDDAFTISVPVTPHVKGQPDEDVTTPLGFVLTKDLLVTIRFAQLHTFEAITARIKRRERSPADIFMVILEAMIDYGADRLEELRAEALRVSQRIFHKEMQEEQQHNVARTNKMLRDTMVEVGDMGERLSYIRDTLLVMQRAVPFVAEHGDGFLQLAVLEQHMREPALGSPARRVGPDRAFIGRHGAVKPFKPSLRLADEAVQRE